MSGTSPGQDSDSGGRQVHWRLWLSIAALVVLAIFIGQNSQSVPVDFLFMTIDAPLIFTLLVTALLGALVAWLLPRVRASRHDD